MSTILLFPGGMPEALEKLHMLKAQSARIVGASSLVNDPARPFYPTWECVPFVTAPDFEDALLALLRTHQITDIFTRHPVVGRFLEEIIRKHQLAVTLDSAAFASATMHQQQLTFARVDRALAEPFTLEGLSSKPPLNRLQMAALMQHVLRIEGQSSDEKILAMLEIFRSCPRGDIVEIGSFWGRSACVLALLAQHYGIGSLLCLDPWRNDSAHQDGVAEHVNAETRVIDFERAFLGFQLNLVPYHHGRVNFIRGDAHVSRTLYKPGFTVTSEAFGTTRYDGKIACLHIDGNHDLAHIRNDIADWVPLVIPGGWIIIDDYQWAFGDGPKIAADAWLAEHAARVACAFETGSALFIKLAE